MIIKTEKYFARWLNIEQTRSVIQSRKKLRRRGLWELCPKWKHTCHVCLQIEKGNRYDTKRPRGFARSSEQINVKEQELGETSERAKRKARP